MNTKVSPPRESVKVDYNFKTYLVGDISPGAVQVVVISNGFNYSRGENTGDRKTYTKLAGVWVQTDSGNLEKLPEASREMNIILDEVVRVAWGTQIK